MPAVIVENDETQWSDETGALYHFPNRYTSLLQPGQRVLYYKGRLRDSAFASTRLSPDAHYFGIATIGRIYPDPQSAKGDQFAIIENYQPFANAVPARDATGLFYEQIPPNRASNYWRDGVREISDEVYQSILKQTALSEPVTPQKDWPFTELQSGSEGSAKMVYTTVYERDPELRRQALSIHGHVCFGCGFDFEKVYGLHGRGFIHIHHLRPLHSLGGPEMINPETDMIPVCPNCHCMIHRRKRHTLSLDELRSMLRPSSRLNGTHRVPL